MSLIYKNITGNTAVEIDEIETYHLTDFNLCNIHDTDPVLVDLYLQSVENNDMRAEEGEGGDFNELDLVTNTYYIIKNLEIAKGVTLYLSESYPKNINYQLYKLYIKLNNGDSKLDLIISGTTNNKNKYIDRRGRVSNFIGTPTMSPPGGY
jgi:hypothetical protein